MRGALISHQKRGRAFFTLVNYLYNQRYNLSYSPLSVLEQKVSAGELVKDEVQAEIMKELDQLHGNISNYTPPSKWSKMIYQSKPPKGLYLYGSVGCGKTMLMNIFFDCCKTERKRKAHFSEFMRDVHAKIHEAKNNKPHIRRSFLLDSSDKPQPWDPVAPVAAALSNQAWLLCFDEFQVTDIADAMVIRQLFTQLFNNGIVLVAMSNRSPDDLYKNGLHRSNFVPFISTLKTHCRVLNLDSAVDYRKREFSKNRRYYFIEGEAKCDEEIDAIFKILAAAETDKVSSKTINVMGRNVVFRKACGGILDATFQELCDQSLGSADYLQLALIFHTIIIRNIPRMNQAARNQARRFIQLIDILYDKKVRVILSAEASPNELFTNDNIVHDRILQDDLKIEPGSENAAANILTGSEEVFAFERTISRLTEMQTEIYWKQSNCSDSVKLVAIEFLDSVRSISSIGLEPKIYYWRVRKGLEYTLGRTINKAKKESSFMELSDGANKKPLDSRLCEGNSEKPHQTSIFARSSAASTVNLGRQVTPTCFLIAPVLDVNNSSIIFHS